MILTNIQGSPYFKVNLFELKTYHEVIDEIYYKVRVWQVNTRKNSSRLVVYGFFSIIPIHRMCNILQLWFKFLRCFFESQKSNVCEFCVLQLSESRLLYVGL